MMFLIKLLFVAVFAVQVSALTLKESYEICAEVDENKFFPFATKPRNQPIFVPQYAATFRTTNKFGDCMFENWGRGGFAVFNAPMEILRANKVSLNDIEKCPQWY